MHSTASTKYLLGLSGFALIASAGAYTWQQRRQQSLPQNLQSTTPKKIGNLSNNSNMAVTTPFQTLFAVPMHCDGCAKSVSDALFKLPGITKVEPNVKDQLVAIEGTAPPSAIVEAIQETGKDAILRGSGSSNGAAVSILETFHDDGTQGPSSVRVPSSILGGDAIPNRMVRGLARMVQVNDTTTLVDLTIHGIAPGLYRATIREYGDLKDGAESTGPVWSGLSTALTEETKKLVPRGNLGTVEIGPNGRGSVFLSHPFQIWEAIGHALAVSPLGQGNGGDDGLGVLKNDKDTVVGVIARSAGMWDNDKTVCSCTGKTLWEERKDETAKGML